MFAQKTDYAVARMARLLEVSRSGFYAWTKRQQAGPSDQAVTQRRLDTAVFQVYDDSEGVYGAPRVTAELARQGVVVNEKTVAKSLRRQGLEGISPRRFRPVTTLPGVETYHIPDLVKRTWDTGELDAVWISDITYLSTWEGFVYLCAIRDGCSRRVLGWAMDDQQTTDLVERAVRMAHTLRDGLPENVVLHADRGSQYTSAHMHDVALELRMRQSVGRTGVCWDNAMSESFWSTLKTEFYDRRTWPTRSEAKQAVAHWIEVVYNRQRLHSSLGMVPPVEFETTMQNTEQHHYQTLTQAA